VTTDQIIRLVEVTVSLIQAIIWPALVLFVVLHFSEPIRRFFGEGREHEIAESTFKAGPGGIEAAIKYKVAASLVAAEAKTAAPSEATSPIDAEKVNKIVNTVDHLVEPSLLRKLRGARVLWVDDNPRNNFYEREALEALGINFVESTSTDDALEKLRQQRFDAIISDMGRPPDPQAGYTLLQQLRKFHPTTPFIIYAGSNRPEHQVMAREKGAYATTNNPHDLFELVLSALQGR
jgi:CheY-like chemotaxis protein